MGKKDLKIAFGIGLASVLSLSAVVSSAEIIRLGAPSAWSRDAGKIVFTPAADGSARIEHTGEHDWAVRYSQSLDVRPGDVFELSGEADIAEDAGFLASSAQLAGADGKVVDYMHAWKAIRQSGAFTNVFMVPPRTKSLIVRLTGSKRSRLTVRNVRLARTERRVIDLFKGKTLENDRIRVTVRAIDAALEVTDKRTGRTWTPVATVTKGLIATADGATVPDGVAVRLFDTADFRSFRAEFRLDAAGDLAVTVDGEFPVPENRPVEFPAPFASRAGDRMIIPMNEGMGFPVDEDHEGLGRSWGYSGHGLCMSFFGVTEDATGAGWMAFVETPDDMCAWARRYAGLWTLGPAWTGSWGTFAYPRRIRYRFLDRGGHVAMCKAYRAEAKARGLFKDFNAKARERPNVDRLLGAANVWCWDGRPLEVISNLHAVGIDRILWSGGGSPENVKAIAALPKTLVGRYDNYQDVPTPELVREGLRKDLGPIGSAWPGDVAWTSPTGGLADAWGVQAKDGRWLYFARMCDMRAPDHARRVIREELKNRPYTARFIDTTVAAPWYECRHPDHPMRRADSRRWKMELLRVVGDEFGLVVGSETGQDASVPYCDYYEGMMSIGPYRTPDAGRRMQEVWTNAPARTVKYMVGERYRLPLWELVYHECVCAHWYWGDHVGKTPELWRKRDLFNALYGTMGLYMFNRRMWNEDKDKYARSYRTTSPIARGTGRCEMLDHRFLTPDRAVQQTVFANGMTVTVNFGDRPFALPDGTVVPPSDVVVGRRK